MAAAALKKLQAFWAKKLAESDFHDLESTDRDAPLSNRGKLHAVTDDDAPALMERMEHGAAYTEWCQDVLHQLTPRHDRQGTQQLRIWRLYANGDSMDKIADKMDLNFHVVRGVINKIIERYKCEKKEPKGGRERKAAMRRMVRRVSTPILIQMAAVMLKITTASSRSRCA